MFGISFGEIIVIFLVAVFATRPSEVPKILSYLKDIYKKIHSYKKEIENEIMGDIPVSKIKQGSEFYEDTKRRRNIEKIEEFLEPKE